MLFSMKTGQRLSARKNRATVPGPEWAPITGPMVEMHTRFTPRAEILSAT